MRQWIISVADGTNEAALGTLRQAGWVPAGNGLVNVFTRATSFNEATRDLESFIRHDGRGILSQGVENNGSGWDISKAGWLIGGAAGGAALVAATPFLLGFTATGVAVGSIAATIQSFGGGYVAAGSLFATMQSVGAVGVPSYALATGAVGGAGVVDGFSRWWQKGGKQEPQKEEEEVEMPANDGAFWIINVADGTNEAALGTLRQAGWVPAGNGLINVFTRATSFNEATSNFESFIRRDGRGILSKHV
eukprot:scaffold8934_cov208-Ochromonas_danica.AAC.2